MKKNPVIYGIAATAYIILIVAILNYGSHLPVHPNEFLVPIAMLSLFTLSAAVMAYIFGYQPVQLYFSGHKEAAVKFFLQTLASFGVITFLLVLLMFSGLAG